MNKLEADYFLPKYSTCRYCNTTKELNTKNFCPGSRFKCRECTNAHARESESILLKTTDVPLLMCNDVWSDLIHTNSRINYSKEVKYNYKYCYGR
jgi:hypothetical protein